MYATTNMENHLQVANILGRIQKKMAGICLKAVQENESLRLRIHQKYHRNHNPSCMEKSYIEN